jgi:hypothetical protein
MQRRFYFSFFLSYVSPNIPLLLCFLPASFQVCPEAHITWRSLWVPRQSLDNYSHARQRNSSAPHSHHAVPTPLKTFFFVLFCSFVCWALGESNPIPSEVLLFLSFFSNFVGILLLLVLILPSWPPVKPSSTWYSRPLLSVSLNRTFVLLSLSSYKCWPVTEVVLSFLNVPDEP